MARPIQPITPPEPLLIVDGHTPFIARSHQLTERNGRPLAGRSCTLALVASEQATAAIHNTLEGSAVDLNDGRYTRTFTPRALWLRLAPHANRVIYLRTSIPGYPMEHTPVRVVWRADTYPVVERES